MKNQVKSGNLNQFYATQAAWKQEKQKLEVGEDTPHHSLWLYPKPPKQKNFKKNEGISWKVLFPSMQGRGTVQTYILGDKENFTSRLTRVRLQVELVLQH